MKKLFYLIAIIGVTLVACSKEEKPQEPQKWEYKIYTATNWEYNGKYGDFMRRQWESDATTLDSINAYGREGWELVDIYTKMETVHPNFGDDKYVTGLQPNSRTCAIKYVFKRPLIQDSIQGKSVKETVIEDSLGVVTE